VPCPEPEPAPAPEPCPEPAPAPAPAPCPEPAPAPEPEPEACPPRPKEISNVVFYLSDGETLIGVKLNYDAEIRNYEQPDRLTDRIETLVNRSPEFDNFVVVGYSVKAGPEIHEFGRTFDEFDNTGGHPALAVGTFDGRIDLSRAEVDSVRPVSLDTAATLAAREAPTPMDPAIDHDSPHLDAQTQLRNGGDQTSDQAQEVPAEPVLDKIGDTDLHATAGADVFKWTLAEPGAHDTITDFRMQAPANGGDVLDLRDLLHSDGEGDLASFLHFEESGNGGTLLRVSADGAFTGDATHDAGVAYQTIELANVDLLSLGSDQQIIDTLIHQNKLITE
jgi:hypothetical protein